MKKLVLLFLVAAPLSGVMTATPALAVGRGGERREKVQVRLTEVKLKVCQAKEAAIKRRTENLVRLAERMQGIFAAKAERVKEYYTTKVVPSGKTVANYSSLVAEIEVKKGAVQTALAKTQDEVSDFACEGDDPKGLLSSFRENMQAVKQALHEYRTAIKNLIVAVRSVTGATERDK